MIGTLTALFHVAKFRLIPRSLGFFTVFSSREGRRVGTRSWSIMKPNSTWNVALRPLAPLRVFPIGYIQGVKRVSGINWSHDKNNVLTNSENLWNMHLSVTSLLGKTLFLCLSWVSKVAINVIEIRKSEVQDSYGIPLCCTLVFLCLVPDDHSSFLHSQEEDWYMFSYDILLHHRKWCYML